MAKDWRLPGTKKDKQSVTADWQCIHQQLIGGVRLKEVKNVVKHDGTLTEVYRNDWQLDTASVDQVFQIVLAPGGNFCLACPRKYPGPIVC